MRIVIDEPKRRSNLAKHGIDQRDVEVEFDFAIAAIRPTHSSRTGRKRFKAIGPMSRHGIVVIVFSPLGTEAIGLISVRTANRKERTLYDEHEQGGA